MQREKNVNMNNLSSRKLWALVENSYIDNSADDDTNHPLSHAAKLELIRRQAFTDTQKYHPPH